MLSEPTPKSLEETSAASDSGSTTNAVAAPEVRLCKDVEGSVTLPGKKGSQIKSDSFNTDDEDAAIAAIDKLRRSLGIAGCITPQYGCDCIFWTGICQPVDFDEEGDSEADIETVDDANTGKSIIVITSNKDNAKLEYELSCGCYPDGPQH